MTSNRWRARRASWRSLLYVGTAAAAVVALAAPSAAAVPPAPAAHRAAGGAVPAEPPAAPRVAQAGQAALGGQVAPAADPTTVPAGQRDRVLPGNWRTSPDRAWTTTGDAAGFHLMVADSRTGYTWRTAATLVEPGIDAGQWIGNACLTASGRRAVVVYAPRLYTNRYQLFDRGAFAAVVDLASGRVRKLPVRVSLAYYNPGCGAGETAVLTQSGAVDLGRTRLHVVDTVKGSIVSRHELAGQVTSAAPVGGRVVAAAAGGLLAVDADGTRRLLARTRGTPYDVHPDRDGGIAYVERKGEAATVKYLPSAARGGPDTRAPRTLARGPVTEVGLAAGADGRVFLTGAPASVAKSLPGTLRRVAAPLTADVSTLGTVAVSHDAPASVKVLARPTSPEQARPMRLTARVLSTGREVSFEALPGLRPAKLAVQGRAASPALGRAVRVAPKPSASAQGLGSPIDPVDGDRTCSVPRNDPRTQVEQPHWRQVEWAADLAVRGALSIQRPYNWKQSGLPAWSPQGMFPRIGLHDRPGAHVPAAVLLGVLAQESNLWQASWHALEGVTGNPLVGNFYGLDIYDSDTSDDWDIRWSEADCGYGVAQVTDGMRRGDPSRTANQQRAIAVDYATNIAAGLRILEDKWNQTYHAGIQINDGDPANIENWFATLWAYNTGLNPQASTGNTTGCFPNPTCTDGRGNYGLGWSNNPANPDYPASRKPFLDNSPGDASHPQDWPYPEKVIGFAASPIVKYDFRTDEFSAGYAQAWWTSPAYRTQAKPPLDTFCDPDANHCDLARPGNPCAESDFHCWWHAPASWKPGCVDDHGGDYVTYTCGFDSSSYDPGDPEPPGGTHYPPVCNRVGLPWSALIVDDVPDSVGIVRPDCPGTRNDGRFSLTFSSDGAGHYPSKIDFHQVGSGLDGHFYFAHTWNQNVDGDRQVLGTWTLNRTWTNRWSRVLVHLPGHGADTQQAAYTVDTGSGAPAPRYRTRYVNTASRYVDVNNRGDRWVSLGVFKFTGTPKVWLSNLTADGTGTEDIAFDAVAFASLPAKPRHVITVLGDSYTSGEGASENYIEDYYRETDNGQPGNRNACHRSPNAWSRAAVLADRPSESIGQLADVNDDILDYHLVACSGAQTENLLPKGTANAAGDFGHGSFGEVSQLEQGYLDENTTLVALSIGGNDVGWSKVLAHCTTNPLQEYCPDDLLPGDQMAIKDKVPWVIQNLAIPSIETVLDKIHERAPNAKIALMGYPRLLSLGAWCLGGALSLGESGFLNAMADFYAEQMSQLVARVSVRYSVTFADPREAFDNKGVCGVPEAIHAIILTKTPGENPSSPISQQSFHPKILGAALYASVFADALRRLGM